MRGYGLIICVSAFF